MMHQYNAQQIQFHLHIPLNVWKVANAACLIDTGAGFFGTADWCIPQTEYCSTISANTVCRSVTVLCFSPPSALLFCICVFAEISYLDSVLFIFPVADRLGATCPQHDFPVRLVFLYSLWHNKNLSAPYNWLSLQEKIVLCLTFLQRGQRSGSTTEQEAWS